MWSSRSKRNLLPAVHQSSRYTQHTQGSGPQVACIRITWETSWKFKFLGTTLGNFDPTGMRWGWAFCVFSKCFRYIQSVEHSLMKNSICFIYLFLVALGLHFCVGAFSSCSKWKVLFIAVHRLLTAVAFSVAENRLSTCGSQTLAQAQELQLMGTVALQHTESSWTKDWTHVPCIGRQNPTYCTTWKLKKIFKNHWLGN